MKSRKVFVMLLILICMLVNPVMASADFIPTYADTVFSGSKSITSSYTLIGSYTVPANAKVTGLKGIMAGSYYFYDYLYYYLNGSTQAVIAIKLYEQEQVSFYYPVSVSAGNTISFYGATSASGDTLGLDISVVIAYDYPSQTLVNQVKTSADNAASYASTASTNASNAANNTTYSGYTAGYLAYYANSNASSANTNAANANTNASNAYNAVNNVNGNTVTAVRDGSGTALAEARLAKTNSLNAYNEAHTANTKLDSLQATVTNIQNNLGGDTSPPVPKVRTVSGAVATSGGSIQAVLEVSDNVSSTFTYSLDGTTYNPLPVNRLISLPVSSPGPNVISVWVKDQAGNVGNTSITIRKL